MNNKRIPALRLGVLLLILGTTCGLPFIVSSQAASAQEDDEILFEKITLAIEALQRAGPHLDSGDTEEAQEHLDAAADNLDDANEALEEFD